MGRRPTHRALDLRLPLEFACGPISWKSKLQAIVTLSSTEVDYLGASLGDPHGMHLDNLMNELGLINYKCCKDFDIIENKADGTTEESVNTIVGYVAIYKPERKMWVSRFRSITELQTFTMSTEALVHSISEAFAHGVDIT
ncbi:hypothetical protein H257_09899 [Aphanomyces astaci]|uniref:Uncharacterized protein n=1 Tax=Aphanomyces astaci TaxID=112090 RepID=W4G8D6_APHAT|nr:hypothetical protein H257_09899 [Aphanomyces astaci]ETV75940.1 hypothetical protein H257_09899 [Aphanomyces astaci]|eukprot:XP_009834582.1 hypothetical protein H257_09899 [Aphanomyces astaci]